MSAGEVSVMIAFKYMASVDEFASYSDARADLVGRLDRALPLVPDSKREEVGYTCGGHVGTPVDPDVSATFCLEVYDAHGLTALQRKKLIEIHRNAWLIAGGVIKANEC